MRDGGALALLICPGYRANHRTLSPHACILQVWVFPPGNLASRRRRSYIWPSPPRAASRRSHFSARPPRKGPRRPRCGRAQARPTTPDTTAAAACGPAPPHRFQLAIQLSASLKQTSKAQALRMYGLFMAATHWAVLLVGTDDRQQQGWLAMLLRAPEASLAVGWTVAAERLRARLPGAESTASAEPESYRTPRRCLRAVRQRLAAWRGLREQRRGPRSRKASFWQFRLRNVTN